MFHYHKINMGSFQPWFATVLVMAEEPSNIETFPNTSDALAGVTARQMPNNLPAEQNLLGALLLDNGVMERIDDRLRADHFYVHS